MIEDGQVVYFEEKFMLGFSEGLFEQFKEHFYDFEGEEYTVESFRRVLAPSCPDIAIFYFLSNFFEKSGEVFRFSHEGATKFVVLLCFNKMNKYIAGELVHLISEALVIFTPTKLYKEKTKEEHELLVRYSLSRNALYSDKINYGRLGSEYQQGDCVIVRSEREMLPQDLKER